jgi:hypothetical protein
MAAPEFPKEKTMKKTKMKTIISRRTRKPLDREEYDMLWAAEVLRSLSGEL